MKIGALVLKVLGNPWTIIAGVLLGFASGFYLKDFSHGLKPIADIYVVAVHVPAADPGQRLSRTPAVLFR